MFSYLIIKNFITYLLAFPLLIYAQTPTFNFHSLGAEDGLNNNNIFNIQQHKSGLIYVTTQNGIYQYDGYNFQKLKLNGINSNVLQNAFLQDDELSISVRNEGIASLNVVSGELIQKKQLKFKNNADQIVTTDKYIYALLSGIRLTILKLEDGQILEQSNINGIAQSNINGIAQRIYCIFKTQSNRILIGKDDGLFDVTDGNAIKVNLPLKNQPVYAINESNNGDLVIGSTNKIIITHDNKIVKEIIPVYAKSSKTFLLGGEKSINKLVVDKYNRIWFTSYPDDNLYVQFENVTFNVFDILDIPSNLINCIYKDNNENIWVGTFNDGLFYIQNPSFNSYSFNLNSKPLNINQVLLKNKVLVAATGNGLYGMNVETNETKILSKPDDIFPDQILGIKEINNTIYYFKKSQFVMSKSTFQTKTNFLRFEPVIATLHFSLDDNTAIVADRLSNLLLTNSNGTKTIDTLVSFPNYRTNINALYKLNDTLFIGTNEGLYIYNFKSKNYRFSDLPKTNYKINDITLINGKIYLAHEGGITDYSGNQLKEQLGNFPLNSVKKIKYFAGKVWLATQNGCLICDKNLMPIHLLDKAFGLQSNNINDISFNENNLVVSTSRGVAVIDTGSLGINKHQLQSVKITSILVDGTQIPVESSIIKLNANQKDVAISFISPYFNKPNKQYYRYRVNNGNWKSIDNSVCNLGNLEGGTSKIEIQNSLNKIKWANSTNVLFEKEKALSNANILYILIILVGLALIAFISWIILKRIKVNALKRLQDEQQMNLLKHQAMNSLLSPHFIFNSLTSIQNYINTNNSLKASEYLAKFSRLIRMIIEKASQSEINLTDELTRLKYYLELEKERFKNKFDYHLEIDPNIDQNEVKIPNMIIQPHVENCIIHGILPKMEHGNLFVRIRRIEAGIMQIQIEDDGIGLIKAKEHAKTGHKSLGTSTIKNILEINSKISGRRQEVTMIDKSTIDANQTGTIITINLAL